MHEITIFNKQTKRVEKITSENKITDQIIQNFCDSYSILNTEPPEINNPTQIPQWNDAKNQWEVIDNPDLDYSDKRQMSYPTLAKQLDSLWHAINSGVDLKQSDFYKKNQEVKQKFPKTS